MVMPAAVPPANAQIKAPEAMKRDQTARSDRNETLALDVMREAVKATSGQNLTARQTADFAEVLWQWVITDTWPKPDGAP